MLDLSRFTGFDWDEGNSTKNWTKHRVSTEEREEVFLNSPLLLLPDEAHSGTEARFYALGMTNTRRKLFVVFTSRGDLLRVISARDMTPAERRRYEEG